MNSYLDGMRRYIDFTGRSTRTQFWVFTLCVAVLGLTGAFLDGITGSGAIDEMGVFSTLAVLGHIVPSAAISVRRLHDIDRSGWWVLIGLVPLVGIIVLVVFCSTPSTPSANRFGPPVNPDEAAPKVNSYWQAPPVPPQQPTPRPEQQPSAATTPLRPVAASPAASATIIEQLERLAALRASGAIDDAEFSSMKADLLARVAI